MLWLNWKVSWIESEEKNYRLVDICLKGFWGDYRK